MPENAITYDMPYKRNFVNRRGKEAYILRVRVPRMDENEAYTGLILTVLLVFVYYSSLTGFDVIYRF